MQFKACIMDADAVNRATVRIAHEILERNSGAQDILLVGIRRRGVPMAKAIARCIRKIEDADVPCGELDVTFYRDDLTLVSEEPTVRHPSLPFDITGKRVILVDDVMYTGRTMRAAIEALFSLGRPAQVQAAVLVDRGHRELPIRPDYVGKNIPTSRSEMASVRMPPFEDSVSVDLYQM